MNKELKYTIPARGSQEITYDTGVCQIAITNYNGNDGEAGENIPTSKTIENAAIARFTDAASAPLLDLVVDIKAKQSGSGVPSPENERPISGFTVVNVGDISDTEKIQYFKGLLDGTHDYVDLGELSWEIITGTFLARSGINSSQNSTSQASKKFISSRYTAQTDAWSQIENYDDCIGIYNTQVRICDSDYATTEAFKSAMNGVYLIYELATPTTPTITPTEFNTLVSAFGLQGWLTQITTPAMPAADNTIYGGVFDVLTGKLIVTHANIASYDGETITEPWISSMDVYEHGATPTTGAQVVYQLETPLEYNMGANEIYSLHGENNIFANTGNIEKVAFITGKYEPIIDVIEDKSPVFFDAVADYSTSTISLVGATSTDINNYLLTHKNANIIIRLKGYSTITLLRLMSYSPNYNADFISQGMAFVDEGTKKIWFDTLRLNLMEETTVFEETSIILSGT